MMKTNPVDQTSVCYNKTHKKFSKEEARLRNFFVGSRAEKA